MSLRVASSVLGESMAVVKPLDRTMAREELVVVPEEYRVDLPMRLGGEYTSKCGSCRGLGEGIAVEGGICGMCWGSGVLPGKSVAARAVRSCQRVFGHYWQLDRAARWEFAHGGMHQPGHLESDLRGHEGARETYRVVYLPKALEWERKMKGALSYGSTG